MPRAASRACHLGDVMEGISVGTFMARIFVLKTVNAGFSVLPAGEITVDEEGYVPPFGTW
ncbi:hypothetical protein ACLB1Q_14870 [Escherichia coli]